MRKLFFPHRHPIEKKIIHLHPVTIYTVIFHVVRFLTKVCKHFSSLHAPGISSFLIFIVPITLCENTNNQTPYYAIFFSLLSHFPLRAKYLPWHLILKHQILLDIGRSMYHFLQYIYIPMRYTM